MATIFDVRVAASVDEIGPCRHALAAALHDCSVDASDADLIACVVSELLTAAVLTLTGPFRVLVEADADTTHASVTDESSADHPKRYLDPSRGFSFEFLDALSESWGISYKRGACLWAELPIGLAAFGNPARSHDYFSNIT